MAFEPRFLKHRGITVIQKLDPSLPRVPAGKVGIVLAGGAVAGGAFKAGGLQALDEILVSRRHPGGNAHPFGLTEFDVFVGLSAGSVLASTLSAGIGPAEIMRILRGSSDLYEAFRPWHFMRPNLIEWPERLALFLSKEEELVSSWLSGATDTQSGGRFSLAATLNKMLQATGRLLPTGIFDSRALQSYFESNMARAGLPNNFAGAFARGGKELYLSATDVNRGELVVFGHDEPYRDVPISQAMAASCALPLWYRPMRIENPRKQEPGQPEWLDLADGGLVRTANVRVAVEKGCELVICYNPFTRIRYDRRGRYLYEHGLFPMMTQMLRTMIGARLDLAKELVFHDPAFKADVVFIEPAEDDYKFFSMGPLNFWTKDRAAVHGYEAVRAAIESAHELLVGVFRSHGIEIRLPPSTNVSPLRHSEMQIDVRESRGSKR